MKKVVANPMELRDAIRCEKPNISITGGFAEMMQPIVTQQEADVEKMDLPTFMKLALDPATMETLTTAYQVAMKNDAQGLELECVRL
ncbi:hypothetical protein JZO77_06235 [Enterococcus hulanensis]|uniref:Uncharacterized protein n=1 Tax=Enterococcus hulanensis TaxID=2559929 RepID=A0ABU3EVE5_9ENTE|nr:MULTISPECIES: hypothetical protein [Enterococcus]MBO0410596.1 hypothetical protein [Enterococcus hulanensis]MBO0456336.1 hypothetical protein [Enterococcus hulanensis]MBX8937765.1 hypothetical protein [Enterococcus gilvus]MDT2598837.1 hypothetical protein [Enterococcus hulanensis]MDT2607659.1 hypothetical protein [Enterococcus hulanensis]